VRNAGSGGPGAGFAAPCLVYFEISPLIVSMPIRTQPWRARTFRNALAFWCASFSSMVVLRSNGRGAGLSEFWLFGERIAGLVVSRSPDGFDELSSLLIACSPRGCESAP